MSSPSHRALKPIVGVVIVSHEQVAFAMLEAARRVVGTLLPNTAVACVQTSEDSAAVTQKMAQACGQVDDGAGVLLLVDVFGSTPFHIAMSMLDGTRAGEVLCGVNLPMLLKLATLERSRLSPRELAEQLRECGHRSIRIGSDLTGKVNCDGSR